MHWKAKFGKEFIYDTFDNTGLEMLGNRRLNRPLTDDEIINFIQTEIIEAIINEIPDVAGANTTGNPLTGKGYKKVKLAPVKDQLRKEWLSN